MARGQDTTGGAVRCSIDSVRSSYRALAGKSVAAVVVVAVVVVVVVVEVRRWCVDGMKIQTEY
jgi:hypothetical protein